MVFYVLWWGGAPYSCGEDPLLLTEAIKKGLRIYLSLKVIGTVTHAVSTWFNGFTDKYFMDKGAFYFCLSKRWSKFLCLQFAVRNSKMFKNEKSWRHAFELMCQGIKQIRG